jgi:hypothetical protein
MPFLKRPFVVIKAPASERDGGLRPEKEQLPSCPGQAFEYLYLVNPVGQAAELPDP